VYPCAFYFDIFFFHLYVSLRYEFAKLVKINRPQTSLASDFINTAVFCGFKEGFVSDKKEEDIFVPIHIFDSPPYGESDVSEGVFLLMINALLAICRSNIS
jgi:hypothetical protein